MRLRCLARFYNDDPGIARHEEEAFLFIHVDDRAENTFLLSGDRSNPAQPEERGDDDQLASHTRRRLSHRNPPFPTKATRRGIMALSGRAVQRVFSGESAEDVEHSEVRSNGILPGQPGGL